MKIIGDKIFYFEIKIDFKKYVIETKNEESSVIGANERLFVINDYSFTKLNQKMEKDYSCYTNLNKPIASEFKCGSLYDEIRSCIYTDINNSTKAYKTLKKKLEDYIYEKHGRYSKGIDILNNFEIPKEV